MASCGLTHATLLGKADDVDAVKQAVRNVLLKSKNDGSGSNNRIQLQQKKILLDLDATTDDEPTDSYLPVLTGQVSQLLLS